MRTLFLIGIAALVCGCSHAYIADEGYGHITACCPTRKIFCTQDKLHDLAAKECSGTVSRLEIETRDSGSMSVRRNPFGGDVTGFNADREQCVTYQCDDAGPSPASVR